MTNHTRKNLRRRIEKIKDICRIAVIIITAILLVNKTLIHIPIPGANEVLSPFNMGFKPYVELNDGEAAVYFLDTGQSDCSLIMTKTHNVLIDGGDLDAGNIITSALNALGVGRLDYVILTHPHVDHFGGFTEILKHFSVGEFLMPDIPEDMLPRTMNYSYLKASLELNNVKCGHVKSAEVLQLGNDSVLEFIAPLYNDYNELNDLSVVTRFVHGDNSFLFTGDLERAGEFDLVNNRSDIAADVLKVGHHGSAGSSSSEFLNIISPKIAVFETDIYNTFGHPRTEVIERLKNAGCGGFCATSFNGNIAVVSDGQDLRVLTEKEQVIYC